MAESVRVAVRVRPFNEREKTRHAKRIIEMMENTTTIKDPEGKYPEKKYTFDFSYWSHDGFSEQENGYLIPENDSRYSDQAKVFDDLGRGVLDNAWRGFNCSLFAYGQTGSGKSYSMVGYNANKGIIPIACEELFKSIEKKDGKDENGKTAEYQVSLSMLEIYNEIVKDLLNPSSFTKGGLKVREHPQQGFYVEKLQVSPVSSYSAIEAKIAEGTRNRTLAATNMNATSSRAHTIVAINFTQKTLNDAGKSMTKSSVINLVDLAGSERADSTGATGERLKEGSMINKSLLCLGNCIKALADQQDGKNISVPFRDSMLTRLLKNALGGNSKTIMIAALSPADINYDETLSTLRFADRAKSIKTKAVVNESPTDKLIREMKSEIQRLQTLLKSQDGGSGGGESGAAVVVQGISPEEVEELKRAQEAELRRNQEEIERMKLDWQQQLEEQKKVSFVTQEVENTKQEARKTTPHLWNLNEDPMLTGMIVHLTSPGSWMIGNSSPADIILKGLGIHKEHAMIENQINRKVYIEPLPDSCVIHNGKEIKRKIKLHHNDRLMFGSNQLYIFHHPYNATKQENEGCLMEKITFEFAQEEIAQNKGFDMNKSGKTTEDILLQEDLIHIMPMVNEANTMSDELDQKMMYSVTLISPHVKEMNEGKTEVCVKAKNLITKSEYVWDRNEFVNRRYAMQEIYNSFIEEENWKEGIKDGFPFGVADGEPTQIGTAYLYLQSLAYLMDMDESLAIRSHTGEQCGVMDVKVVPCSEDGISLEDDCVEDPNELLGKNYQIRFQIDRVSQIPKNFTKIWCRYHFLLSSKYEESEHMNVTVFADLNYVKTFYISPITNEYLHEFEHTPVLIHFWGEQVAKLVDPKLASTPTHTLMAMEANGGFVPEESIPKRRAGKNEFKRRESDVHNVKKYRDKAKKFKEEIEKENAILRRSYFENKEKLLTLEQKLVDIKSIVTKSSVKNQEELSPLVQLISDFEPTPTTEFEKADQVCRLRRNPLNESSASLISIQSQPSFVTKNPNKNRDSIKTKSKPSTESQKSRFCLLM